VERINTLSFSLSSSPARTLAGRADGRAGERVGTHASAYAYVLPPLPLPLGSFLRFSYFPSCLSLSLCRSDGRLRARQISKTPVEQSWKKKTERERERERTHRWIARIRDTAGRSYQSYCGIRIITFDRKDARCAITRCILLFIPLRGSRIRAGHDRLAAAVRGGGREVGGGRRSCAGRNESVIE